MQIESGFDGGNIEIRRIDGDDAELAIRPDRYSSYFQWFAFRVIGARGRNLKLRIVNAGESSYAKGWHGYRAAASEDRATWRRLDTAYADGVLTISAVPASDVVWIAYFALYTEEQHEKLLGRVLASPRARAEVIDRTLDGRPLDMVTIGSGAQPAWVIARQHSGETMASYFIEGFLERLLDPSDTTAQRLRERLSFRIVPNMNPDGSRRGHLRCNAAGVDLNREWAKPDRGRSPEVLAVRNRMDKEGCDFFLDVHGDEENPHNFIIGSREVPSHSRRMTELFDDYRAALVRANPDYMTHNGYWSPGSGPANLAIASNQIAERFRCLSMTLEMPFSDESDRPDAIAGWSPQRSHRLGRDTIDAIAAVVDRLR
jgi:murein tripeptide amidase MpaA